MEQIKLLDKNTDFTKIKLSKMGWDTYCNKKYYEVYLIEGFIHSIGGRWGTNKYWACPRNEKPCYNNLIEFSGEPCCWSFTIESTNSLKTKWDETEMRHHYGCTILRNDQIFYQFGAHDLDFGLSRIRQLLFIINEHPINFNEQNFEKQIIGRKIYWREQSSIIVRYSTEGTLTIVPEGQQFFNSPCYQNPEDTTEKESTIVEDLFAPSIYWFRNSGKE
jgi:hypothetical protein